MDDYEWAGFMQRRCRGRLREKFLLYRGRCDRRRNHHGPHALERGMEVIEFSVTYERKLAPIGRLIVEKEIRRRQEDA